MPKIGIINHGQATNGRHEPPAALFATPTDERREKLAISLEDTDRLTDATRQKFLAGRLEVVRWLRLGEGEGAVQFTCDLLTAATICDILRSHDRECGDEPTRVYVNRGGDAWTRVPGATVLTAVGPDGAVTLNPATFPTRPTAEAAAPPRPRAVQFGGVQ